MNKWCSLIFLFLVASLSTKTLAHGSKIQYTQTSAITIRATYDNDVPMANAQVVIYSPVDPATPWRTGTTDQQGQYTFIPDVAASGNWDVKVRHAGHGGIRSIPITEGKLNSESTVISGTASKSDYSTAQKMLMAVMSIWGFIGTALFFSRPKSVNSGKT